jgi:hypothetical protein
LNPELAVLIAEAMSVYFLVLWAHSLRRHAGLAPFYALIGGITAIMSWVTDAGIKVDVAGITFMVGSTVFYTMHLWLRSFLTLPGVMWLDVLLFATGAFAGSPHYFSIMQGTLLSRFIVSLFACPFLYLYLSWQNKTMGVTMENRPVLTILKELSEIRVELSLAQREIEHRKAVEREKEELIRELQRVLSEVKTLRGFLPICANCKKIRDDEGYWQQIEQYVEEHSEAVFSHGLCPDCADSLYPGLRKKRNP